MPITNPFERVRIRALGFDPDEVDLVEVGSETPPDPVQQSPTVSPTPEVTKLGAGVRSFAREFPATAAGLVAGTQVASAALPLAATPVVGPFIPPVAGIGAGLLAGFGTRKLQDAAIRNLLPQSVSDAYVKSEKEDYEQQRGASTVGRLVASLPLMRPSVGTVKNAANLLRGQVKPENIQSAANVLLGGAVPAGMRAATDDTATAKDLMLEFFGGSVMHKPTGLGRAMGVTGPTAQPKIDPNEVLLQLKEANAKDAAYKAEYESQPYIQALKQKEAEVAAKEAAATQIKDLKRREFEADQQIKKEIAVETSDKALETQRAAEIKAAQEAKTRAEDFTKAKVEELVNNPPDIVARSIVEQRGTAPKVTELGQEIYPDYTGNQEIDNTLNATQPKTQAEQIQEFFDNLKVDTKGKFYDAIQGIPVAVWNGALDAAKLSVKGGANALKATQDARKWVKDNYPDLKIDEDTFNSVVGSSVGAGLNATGKIKPDALEPSIPAPEKSLGTKAIEGTIGRFVPEIDKIERIGTPEAKTAAGGLRNFFDKYNTLRGKFVNTFGRSIRKEAEMAGPVNTLKSPLNYWKQNTPDLDKVRDWYWAKQDGEELPTLTPKQEKLKETVVGFLKFVRDEHKARPALAKHVDGYNPDYLPNTVSPKAIRTITQKPQSAEALKLKNEFLDYQISRGKAATRDEAEKILKEFLTGFQKKDVNLAEQFGPIDKSAGIGIPKSWRDPNLIDSITRYADRVSRRFAYHDTVESNPGVLAALETYKGEDSTASVMRQVTGQRPAYSEEVATGLTGVLKSQMMGTTTGARDFASGLTLGFQHHENPLHGVKTGIKALGSIKKNIDEAWDSGRIRHNLSSLESDAGVEDFVSVLRRVRDVGSDVSGRNFFDQMIRSVNFGQGKEATLDFHRQFLNKKLSAQGKAWFKNFAEGVDWEKSELSPADLQTIASRYVDNVQGTYDPRGLPKVTYEGSFSPVLALSRWGIEKSNNFLKYTVKPATEGNWKPALNATVGMLLGGQAVNYITEQISGKKQKTPTVKELAAEPSSMAAFYKLAGLASAAGHVGILGDMTKHALDRVYAKTRPQEINNVLLEATDGAIDKTAQFISTANEDGMSIDLLVDYVSQLLEDNIQNYRTISAHINSDDTKLANEKRDLRTFNIMTDRSVGDQRGEFTKPMGRDTLEEFKKTDDLEQAENLLPELVNDALKKSGGSLEKFKAEIGKLKALPTPGFPSIDDKPESFEDFYNFLVKTQGKEEADKRMDAWMEKKMLNKAKAEKVPTP